MGLSGRGFDEVSTWAPTGPHDVCHLLKQDPVSLLNFSTPFYKHDNDWGLPSMIYSFLFLMIGYRTD
jgi:hypothetical protein